MPQRGTGSGDGTRREFRRGLNKERGLGTKVLHLVHEYRSPNRDWELNAGELNGREMEVEELT